MAAAKASASVEKLGTEFDISVDRTSRQALAGVNLLMCPSLSIGPDEATKKRLPGLWSLFRMIPVKLDGPESAPSLPAPTQWALLVGLPPWSRR